MHPPPPNPIEEPSVDSSSEDSESDPEDKMPMPTQLGSVPPPILEHPDSSSVWDSIGSGFDSGFPN